jgi:type IV pilus assembly protein PilM
MNLLTSNFFGLKTKAFGLEIENSSLKAVWIEKRRNKFRLEACGKKNIPRGIVQSEQIINPKKLGQEIADLLSKTEPKPIRTKNVICSIPETKAFVRTIQIPKMADEEAREAVKWETEANIPISVDKVYLDWQVTREVGGNEEVLVVAVPKNVVDVYYEAATLAGLNPIGIEIDAVATIRSLVSDGENEKPLLIADVGAENTSLAICQNRIPYFTSSIPLSGGTFTEAIQKELGVGWEKAENIKFKFGLGELNENDVLSKTFKPLIENLATEIEKSIVFFAESINSQDKVGKVILAGGGAMLNSFSDQLGSRLGMEVVMGNPIQNLDTSHFPYKISPKDLVAYATAVGLALRGADYEN